MNLQLIISMAARWGFTPYSQPCEQCHLVACCKRTWIWGAVLVMLECVFVFVAGLIHVHREYATVSQLPGSVVVFLF